MRWHAVHPAARMWAHLWLLCGGSPCRRCNNSVASSTPLACSYTRVVFVDGRQSRGGCCNASATFWVSFHKRNSLCDIF